MKRNTILLFVVLLLLAIFAWAGWANWQYRKQAAEKRLALAAKADLVPASSPDAMLTSSPLIGKPAPNFTLQDLSGKKISLDSYKGKAVMINFWATWCGPCKIETPWLVELRDEYASKGFEILGISAEDDDLADNDIKGWAKDKAAIASFVKQEHMSYPVLINGDSISNTYGGLEAMPTSFFVDRTGKVVAVQLGITSKDDMAAKIQKALAE
ncbi:MAG TPA: TlpA disulfide reductase family protein [Terracidiphilus sp.]|nr:TlpA disulfide reductase family protein [Terracidiphilus sp.]